MKISLEPLNYNIFLFHYTFFGNSSPLHTLPTFSTNETFYFFIARSKYPQPATKGTETTNTIGKGTTDTVRQLVSNSFDDILINN
jgi:hypothetical protein